LQAGRVGIGPLRGGPDTNSPGQLRGAATLKALLMRAYGLKEYQIIGPAWMDAERFEVVAKVPSNADHALVSKMLQSLLAERFHLATHRETRELPSYAMLVAKNGLKMAVPPKPEGPAADNATPVFPKMIQGPDGLPDFVPGSNVPRTFAVVVGG